MKILRIACVSVLLTLLTVGPASATPSQVSQTAVEDSLEQPQMVGKARLKVMLWKVFDAALYADNGIYDPDQPFALSLTYLRSLKGADIVEKSIEEIERLSSGQIARDVMRQWDQALGNIIPDVSKGTTITGVRTAEGFSRFYRNDEFIGEIKNPLFTQLFFSIWLGEGTTDQTLRNRLLGLTETS